MSDVLCPNCQSPNRPEARYCARCGRRLAAPPATVVLDAPTQPGAPVEHPTVVLREPAVRDESPPRPAPGNGPATTILNRPQAREPLPEGAFLADRYLILAPLDAAGGTFAYRAEDTGAAPYGPECLIKESAEPSALAGELAVQGALTAGEGLRPPYDAFSLTLGADGPRTFVVLDGGQPFEALPWPVEGARALEQGAALARGLAAVHAAGLAFGPLDARRVRGDEQSLYLADFTGCSRGSPAAYDRDVRGLAALVNRMLTGAAESEANAPPPAGRLAAIARGQTTLTAAALARTLTEEAARLRRPRSLDLRVGRRTDLGRMRDLNEDSLLALEFVTANKSLSHPVGLFVVADGMGGHEGGEIASGLLVQTLAAQADGLLAAAKPGAALDAGQWLTDAIQVANAAVYERARTTETDMGTTVVAALVIGNEATIAHVGDSRAYRVHAGGIEPLTVDHSLVESMVASNQITREEARGHPQANVIYRTIGDKRQVVVDLDRVTLGPDESLLLCSDGLNGMMRDEAIQALIAPASSPQAACDALVSAANAAGGEDNISVILVRLEEMV